MRIGIPTEVKDHEYRVSVTPAGARALTDAGHEVLVQAGAGLGSGLPGDAYVAAGARIVPDAADAWGADLVCKIKEPVESEYRRLRRDLVLFTYLHLAANRPCTEALLAAGTTSIGYETVQLADGSLPLLVPMSEVAGRLATQAGAHHLLKNEGGRGVLLGGVPGARPGQVVVLGAGTAGRHATEMAVGMHAEVTVLDVSLPRLRELDARYGGRVRTLASTAHAVQAAAHPSWWTTARSSGCGPGRCSSTSRSTRVAASRTPGLRRTATRRSRCTARCSTASPTCPVPCR